MPNPHASTNPFVSLLEKELKRLESNEDGSGDIVRFQLVTALKS